MVITTVGPYIRYGEPLVAACAAAGTDYVDLTGEPEFVDRMWLGYHERAQASGARLVHSCGFDSIPYDLGAQFTVEQMPEGAPISLEGFVRVGGTFSGGTYQSTIEILSRLRQGMSVARERRSREPRPSDRRVRGASGAPHQDEFAGGWVLPLPTIDPQTVLRSARALERYGPDFSYSHYLVARRLPVAVGLAGGAAGLIALAQIPPARRMLLKLKSSGSGPSPEEREKAWFRVRFRARSDGGQPVLTEVSGGDPGYGETSKMLAESALCLAFDELPKRAGQLTPAVAMGDALRRRLVAAGMKFEVLDGGAVDGADMPDQSGRVAVVTGANSGLGLATARELARAGATVVWRAAAPRGATRRPSGFARRCRGRLLEVADARSGRSGLGAPVRRADGRRPRPARPADQQRRHHGRAAPADQGRLREPVRDQPPRALRAHRTAAGTRCCEAPAPRVVTVSSHLHRRGTMNFDDLQGERSYSPWGAYGQSKLANLMFCFELAAPGRRGGQRAAQPGRAPRLRGDQPPVRRDRPFYEKALRWLGNRLIAQSADMGALPTLYAATVPTCPAARYVGPGGRGEQRGYPMVVSAAGKAYDEADWRRLWEVSEELTGVHYEFAEARA